MTHPKHTRFRAGDFSIPSLRTAVLLMEWMSIIVVALLCGSQLKGEDLKNTPVLSENVVVYHFERMNYPLKARIQKIQGVVVVKATVDAEGRVTNARAITGPKLFLADCVENTKKWSFSETQDGTAFVTYVFKIVGFCEFPCPANFEFYGSRVEISVGMPIVDH